MKDDKYYIVTTLYDSDEVEDYYATEDGRIFSTKKPNSIKEVKQWDGWGGYKRATLKGGNQKHYQSHQFIAKCLKLPKEEEQTQINHKDGNRQNNHIDNLEWVSASDNIKHSFEVVQPKRANETLTFKQKQRIIELYGRGYTNRNIYLNMGVKASLVHDFIDSLGLVPN